MCFLLMQKPMQKFFVHGRGRACACVCASSRMHAHIWARKNVNDDLPDYLTFPNHSVLQRFRHEWIMVPHRRPRAPVYLRPWTFCEDFSQTPQVLASLIANAFVSRANCPPQDSSKKQGHGWGDHAVLGRFVGPVHPRKCRVWTCCSANKALPIVDIGPFKLQWARTRWRCRNGNQTEQARHDNKTCYISTSVKCNSKQQQSTMIKQN